MKRALALILALCCITGLALGKSDKAHGQRFTVSTGMNLGVVLSPPSGSGLNPEHPFINEMLVAGDDWGVATADSFCSSNTCYPASPILTADSNGYPTSMAGSGAAAGETFTVICSQVLNGFTFPAGAWLIKYSGDGVHPIANAGTIVLASGGAGSSVGTITDNTAGRLVVTVASPQVGSLHFCITATDPNSTGNYIRNISIISCGASAAPCTNGNEAAWVADNYALNPVWTTAFGTKHVSGPGFSSYRTMKWTKTDGLPIGGWAQRTPQGAFSYAATFASQGVAWETIFHLGNVTCANMWVNIPMSAISVVTDGSATASLNSGTLTISGLTGTAPTGDYVRSRFFGTGSIASGTPDILTITAVTDGYLAVGATLPYSSIPGTVIVSQTGGATGGIGTYTLSTTGQTQGSGGVFAMNETFGTYITGGSGGTRTVAVHTAHSPTGVGSSVVASSPVTFTHLDLSYMSSLASLMASDVTFCPGQTYTIEPGNELWGFNNIQEITAMRNLSTDLWGNGGNDGGFIMMGTLSALASSVFKNTGGLSASNMRTVVGMQDCCPTFATNTGVLLYTPYYSAAPAYQSIDYLAFAPYWFLEEYNVPSDWVALSDNGVANLTAELLTGNQVNNQVCVGSTIIAGHCVGSDGVTVSGGSSYGSCGGSCAYIPLTVTSGACPGVLGNFSVSGGVLSMTLINGGENCTNGSVLGVNNSHFGSAGSGFSATVTNVTGSDPNTTGIIPQVNVVNQSILTYLSNATAFPLPVPSIVTYEGGESLLIASNASPILTLLCAWDSYSGAQTATSKLLTDWQATIGSSADHVFHYFDDASACGYPSSWGLLLDPTISTNMPKYNAAKARLPWLLNRDLNPASNDDSPVGLDKAA